MRRSSIRPQNSSRMGKEKRKEVKNSPGKKPRILTPAFDRKAAAGDNRFYSAACEKGKRKK
jgi:hypothetical protein